MSNVKVNGPDDVVQPEQRTGTGTGNSAVESPPTQGGGVGTPATELLAVPLDAVTWGEQPREEFEDGALDELAASLKRDGLLTPIRVRKTADGRYVGVCGERRFRAAKRNGDATILAVVVEGDLPEADVLFHQLAENEYRQGLKPAERAGAYRRLMTLRGWTAKQLAEYLGVSEAKISQELKLLDLPDEIQKDVDAGTIPASTAVEIARAAPEDREELVRQVKEDGATREQVKESRRKAGTRKGKKGDGPKPNAGAPKPAAAEFALTLHRGGYTFAVTKNKLVIGGAKIRTTGALVRAARELLAAAEAAHERAENNPADRPETRPPATPIALSPPPGTVPDGNTQSETPKEEKS